jgi:diguanylate cyclase (GGDEF)-like protein
MFHSGRPRFDPRRIAEAVASAADLDVAFDRLVTELASALDTRACILRLADRGWALVAQSRGGMGVPMADLLGVLNALPQGPDVDAVNLESIGDNVWTSMAIDASGAPLVVLLAGDWTQAGLLDALGITLSFALRTVQERQWRRRAEHALIDGYVVGRRLTRGGGVEAACQRIVHQVARFLHADRVTLALHQPDDDRITIIATSAPSAADLHGVRIEPGTWVIGHVYASKRSVVVADVRELPGMAPKETHYRSFSFAAVPMLSGGDPIGVLAATDKRDGSTFLARDVSALRSFSVPATLAVKAAISDAEAHRLAHAATVDSLTGLFNRPYMDARLHQEFERARRGSSPLTLLLADIDDFKSVNDTHGHQTGDAVLQTVAAVLRSAVRVFDVCARYGGDEFVILMPSSDQSSAAACAERIRRSVAESAGGSEATARLPRVTLSVGIAVLESGDTPPDLIRRADECLYVAKAEGKNRVRLSGPPPLPQRVPFTESNRGQTE